MEIETKNLESVNKVCEDSKIMGNPSDEIDPVAMSDEKMDEIVAEPESKDSETTKELGADEENVSETKELSGDSLKSKDTAKTCPSPSGESDKSPSVTTTPKSPSSTKINSGEAQDDPQDPAASMTLEKLSEEPANVEMKEESQAAESVPENTPKSPKSSEETAKIESPKKMNVEEICEFSAPAEDAKINEEPEDEDLENGQDDDEDDEIVEHEDESSGQMVDPPEVGIVGPPTAVRDIVNDEELGTAESSSLPSDTKNNETTKSNNNRAPDVAEWIERSRLTNDAKEENAVGINKAATKRRKKSPIDLGAPGGSRKSQKIVTSIIRRSIKCLNKMHAAAEYGSGGTSGKKLESSEKREEDCRSSPKVPQSRQNGAALPEETATALATSASHVNSERLRPIVKSENPSDDEAEEQSSTVDSQRSLRQRSSDQAPSESPSPRKKSPLNSARGIKMEREPGNRKRRSNEDSLHLGQQMTKKMCFEQRELFIDSLVGTSERVSAEELATRADKLRAEVQALDELARAKEMEWNEILSMRKLKEEAYLRIERRRQVVGYMESNGQLSEDLPPASLSLIPDWESSSGVGGTLGENSSKGTKGQESLGPIKEGKESMSEEVRLLEAQEGSKAIESCREMSPAPVKKEKTSGQAKTSNSAQKRTASPKQLGENGRKQQQRNQQQQPQQRQQQMSEQQNVENRQIGEGRQGPIVDVRSIIADYRLRHPETVPRRYDNNKKESAPRGRESSTTTTTSSTTNTRTSGLINVRRGRRMRNSVNIGLAAGGAMVETTHHNVDSRPSSTDSCKSSNERTNPDNSMSFKDVLVQFAKLSQQQGEPVKTPQNYPDVTLHPVAPTTVTINSTPTQQQQQQQTSGSLLHGILTKSQSPRPTTFSPTLARLLTAPERERTNLPTSITAVPQQNIQTQHLLQTYQGSNPVSISDLLSSSKARTEITITPVHTPMTPSHASQSNSLVHVDDVEEETSLLDERDSRLGSSGRDNREERDSPPRCQGCQERAAQFVCAGCGNQWYCSRDCQVAAWDDHSEVCSG